MPGFGHLAEVVSDQTDCNLCFFLCLAHIVESASVSPLCLAHTVESATSILVILFFGVIVYPSRNFLTLLRVSCELEILVAKLLVVELRYYIHIAKPCERAGYTSWVAGCPDQPLDLYTRCPTMCECSDYNIPV